MQPNDTPCSVGKVERLFGSQHRPEDLLAAGRSTEDLQCEVPAFVDDRR